MSKKVSLSFITRFEMCTQIIGRCEDISKSSALNPVFQKREQEFLKYRSHSIETCLDDVEVAPITRVAKVSTLQVKEILSTSSTGESSKYYEISCTLPDLFVGDSSKANRIKLALDLALQAVAKHWYVYSELTEIESLLLVMELEINNAISKALYRKNQKLVRANIELDEWYSVRFLAENNEPLLAVWDVRHCTTIL